MSPSPFIYRFTLTKDEGEVVYGVNFERVKKISGVASVAEIQVRYYKPIYVNRLIIK